MLAEVALVGAVLFVVLLDQDVLGEVQQRGGVGECADEVGVMLYLLVDPFEGVCGPDLPPVRVGERRERE